MKEGQHEANVRKEYEDQEEAVRRKGRMMAMRGRQGNGLEEVEEAGKDHHQQLFPRVTHSR